LGGGGICPKRALYNPAKNITPKIPLENMPDFIDETIVKSY
jgi:hypothetical protein